MSKWFGVKDVLGLIPVSRATLDRWVHDPDYEHLGFPKPFRVGDRIFWEEMAIRDYVETYPKR